MALAFAPPQLRAWRPVLQGGPADRALRAVTAIAADLRRFVADPHPHPALWARHPGRELSLAAGWPGIALFFAELDRTQPGRGHDETAADLLERAIAATGGQQAHPGLYGGFPGVAWTLEHLTARLFESEAGDDPGEEVAAVLARRLGRSPWTGDYDLVSGLAGLGAYALERSPRARGLECLQGVVARLAETAELRPEGMAWRTPPERTDPEIRDRFPAGCFNLGVAHGVPGVIAVLAAAWAAGAGEARPLLDGAVAWLLEQKLPPGGGSIFPAQVGPEPRQAAEPSRLAWCYGDLGIAGVLLAAARAAGEAGWEREALAIARAAAARLASDAAADAGLCHGAAGIAHLFNRLHQASGDPLLAGAVRTWLGRALDRRRPGARFGGFQCWADGPQGEGWYDDPGFLMGAAGIGLALLAAATPLPPAWDRVLLLSHSDFAHPESGPAVHPHFRGGHHEEEVSQADADPRNPANP